VHFSLVGKKKMLGGGADELHRYRERQSAGLFATDADHPKLGELEIPVRRDSVENQAKVAALAWFDGRGRDWLGIDVRLAGTYQAERDGRPLGKLTHIAMEANLDGDGVESAIAGIGDLAVDVGDLSPGKAGRFAHLYIADGQLGGIRVRITTAAATIQGIHEVTSRVWWEARKPGSSSLRSGAGINEIVPA
jgi:hypothetical protein